MKDKVKIKVIKKNSVKIYQTSAVVIEKKTKHNAASDMVSTVSDWVNEFQKRRREETKQAFEYLSTAGASANH